MSGVTDRPFPPERPGGGLAMAGYVVLSVATAVLSFAWLVVGAVVGVAAHVPSVAAVLAAAAEGSAWARGVLDAAPHSEPPAQAVLDYGFSLLSIGLAVALAVTGRSWSIRLLVLALIGSAGAFNLQAHAAATAVETATGLAIGGLHQVLLHSVACAAYILALLVFPPDREIRPAGFGRTVLALAGAGTLLLVGFGTALLPHTASCVLFFGFLVPIAGLIALPRQVRRAPTAAARTQARLLFSVLAATFAVAIVLAVITTLLESMGSTEVVLVDPTAGAGGGQPTALLFWFARLACIAIAGAVLVAAKPGGLWTAERRFSRGLAAALTAALVGGGYVVTRTVGYVLEDRTPDAALVASGLATAAAVLAFLPVYVRAERVVDRLLYGSRPTPYSVLAGVAALSRATATDAPDLTRVAEAVGRGLGATTCRLTVLRPGLRDRTYTWEEPGARAADALVEVPVHHGAERVGAIAVDHGAVAGLQRQRQHLLEDIADSLGVVLQASRSGIELERQLRAALAHANEIAGSRRAVVAEMDAERRRIERDLHDGAQHHLVSLRLILGLVEHQVSSAQFDQARARLAQVADQIDTAELILAETATGVSAPLLAELGLLGALEKELGGAHPAVTIRSEPAVANMSIPPNVEAAVYFCCLEAVNNARKHAPGAPVSVDLRIVDGRLLFSVHDDGPGFDSRADGAARGRGVRNMAARMAAVGGRIEVRSEPGAGTTVEGSQLAVGPPAVADAPAPIPHGPRAAGTAPAPLIDQVRDAVRAARELYHGTSHADPLRELAERLDEPLRIAVAGAPGSGTSVIVDMLAGASAGATLVDLPGLEPSSAGVRRALASDAPYASVADAYVLLLRHRHPDDAALYAVLHRRPAPHRPAHALGVLVGVDELLCRGPDAEALVEWATAECAGRPEVRRLCHVVVPVATQLARAATIMTDAHHRTLQRWVEGDAPVVAVAATSAGGTSGLVTDRRGGAAAQSAAPDASAAAEQLVDQFGPAGLRLAAELLRSGQGPTRDALAATLLQRSGAPRVRELVAERLTCRAEALKARSTLLALEAVARADPPPGGGGPLLYQLDRIRSATPQLAEIDLVDALRAGELELPDEERRQAERLLGAGGDEPRVRLGLPPDASLAEVLRAATHQQAHWRRRELHPLVSSDVRSLAGALARAAERLMAGGAER